MENAPESPAGPTRKPNPTLILPGSPSVGSAIISSSPSASPGEAAFPSFPPTDYSSTAIISPYPSSTSLSSMADTTANMPRAGAASATDDWYKEEGKPNITKALQEVIMIGFDISVKQYVNGTEVVKSVLSGKNGVSSENNVRGHSGGVLTVDGFSPDGEIIQKMVRGIVVEKIPWFLKQNNSAGVSIPDTWKKEVLPYWIAEVASTMDDDVLTTGAHSLSINDDEELVSDKI